MWGLLFVAVTCLLGQAWGCCSPYEYEGSIFTAAGVVTQGGAVAYEGRGSISRDHNNGLLRIEQVSLHATNDTPPTVFIANYSMSQGWVELNFENLTCVTFNITYPEPPRCIPDEAITSHFTLGSDIAASGHAIDHFEDGQEWYMSERDCTVLDQTLMMPKFQVGPLMTNNVYSDLTEGIRDPSIFNPPEDCVPVEMDTLMELLTDKLKQQ